VCENRFFDVVIGHEALGRKTEHSLNLSGEGFKKKAGRRKGRKGGMFVKLALLRSEKGFQLRRGEETVSIGI